MEQYCFLVNKFIVKHYKVHLILAACMCLGSNFLWSFRNLEFIQAARIMETYVSLFGIVLLCPLFEPERVKEIWDIEKSKETPQWKVYAVRVLVSVVTLAIVVTIFVGMLIIAGNHMDYIQLWKKSFCEALFLGSIGFFFSGVTNQMVVGYMVSIIYYVSSMMENERFSVFSLFQMTSG